MSEKKLPKKVRYIYYQPKDYKIYPVNGAWGGPTTRNDIIIHFFVERQEMPVEEVHLIAENGLVGPVEREMKEEAKIARELQVGIIINPEEAERMAAWLKEKVAQSRKMKEQTEQLEKKSEGESRDEHD
jgi:hypothetical protein